MAVPAPDRRQTTVGVLAIALLGLLLRLFALGWRVFHWDEARVGYWILQYQRTGHWTYRPIVHGPFLFQVNDVVFSLLGPTDFAARLVVALVGAALPLVALLFRERLRPVETLALAAFLALNPVLLYYSRFMRNDVLVAAFALATVGFAVRLLDTGRPRYLFAAVASFALAFTTKEIVIVYVAVWVGALALLFDHRLVAARYGSDGWRGLIRAGVAKGRRAAATWWPYVAIGVVEFLVVVAFFYAPRPDLYRAFGDPARFPAVIDAATIGAWKDFWSLWVAGGHKHSYVDFLVTDTKRFGVTSLPLLAFGVGGFLVDRYADERPSDLVAFGFYWAAAIFLIYPAITDISAPWGLVHVAAPLAIPAARGVRLLVDRGLVGWVVGDRVAVGLVVVVLLAATVQVGTVAYATSYGSPQANANPLVQFGQPAGHLQSLLATIERISKRNPGTDVLFVGEHFYVSDESNPTAGPHWTNRFPLTWYLARANATVASTNDPSAVNTNAPVVIALAKDYSAVNASLTGYTPMTFEITASDTATVFFVKTSALDGSVAGSAAVSPAAVSHQRSSTDPTDRRLATVPDIHGRAHSRSGTGTFMQVLPQRAG